MERDLLSLIRSFTALEVLVVGDAMLDAYLHGSADRLCREAPVPVVALEESEDSPGGAANTAVNTAALGAQTAYLGVVGDDGEGQRLRTALESAGLSRDDVVVDPGRRTLGKCRIVAGGQLVARLDTGDTRPISREAESQLIDKLVDAHGRCDMLVISDYGYGTITDTVIDVIARLQRRAPKTLVIDGKSPERFRRLRPTAVKPNYGEVVRLLGIEERNTDRAGQLEPFEERLLELTGAQIVAATLDREGALVFEGGAHPYRTYARPMPNSHATGAGDTFTAALALALAAGGDAPGAAECASAAASVVVSRDGTTVCCNDELLAALALESKVLTGSSELAERVGAAREAGRRVVFTNGCFDILHRGHVTYLSRAKALGDVLIVGINGDAQVRAQKGSGRPINPLEDRIGVLAALSCVDYIVAFEEPTPKRLIEQIRPDVFVKGGDYREEDLPEAPLVRRLGGAVQLLPYLDGRSTTGIIERARSNGEALSAAGGG